MSKLELTYFLNYKYNIFVIYMRDTFNEITRAIHILRIKITIFLT